MKWLTIALGLSCLVIVSYAFVGYDTDVLQGRIVPAHLRGEVPWKTILPSELENGVTIPPHTNVLIQFPPNMKRLSRRVLFGERGKTVRYWGYCFPKNPGLSQRFRKTAAFPGTVFLSEKERMGRYKTQDELRRGRFSVYRELNRKYLDDPQIVRGRIRHQQEIFEAGMTCYVMTEAELPAGTDVDNDRLNSTLERDSRTDPLDPDTDGDGITDGLEVLRLRSMPIFRDSDNDGLNDGIEDKNHNGRVDFGETSPIIWDTDKDGLCDGWCVVVQGRNVDSLISIKGYVPSVAISQQISGEDENLNGEVDEGETDPLNADTDGDGILDLQEFFNCQLAGAEDCS